MKLNVGDEVRVVVRTPHHGWGSVTSEDIGEIVTIADYSYYVDFLNHPYWKGREGELGLVNREPDWEV